MYTYRTYITQYKRSLKGYGCVALYPSKQLPEKTCYYYTNCHGAVFKSCVLWLYQFIISLLLTLLTYQASG